MKVYFIYAYNDHLTTPRWDYIGFAETTSEKEKILRAGKALKYEMRVITVDVNDLAQEVL